MKEFSKKLASISWVPFLFVIGFVIYLMATHQEINETIFIALISASGGIAATTNIFYLRKSQAENTYKVKLSLYEKVSEIDIKHLEESLKLKKEYGEIDETENESHFSGLTEYAYNDLTDQVNSDMDDATQRIEKEEVNV